jgi:hypothetical protein
VSLLPILLEIPLGRRTKNHFSILESCWAEVFGAVAWESQEGSAARKPFANRILEEFGWSRSFRLVLAGMMADFRWECFVWLTTEDVSSPDSTRTADRMEAFKQRL